MRLRTGLLPGGGGALWFGALVFVIGLWSGCKGGPLGDPERCIVAKSYGTCCAAPRAATAREVHDDPCLVEWPFDGTVPRGCADCSGVRCTGNTPMSLRAERDAKGVCRIVDECASPADCGIATQSGCCACSEVFPLAVIERTPCLTTETKAADPGCKQCEGQVRCGPCPPRPQAFRCEVPTGGTLKRCLPAP